MDVQALTNLPGLRIPTQRPGLKKYALIVNWKGTGEKEVYMYKLVSTDGLTQSASITDTISVADFALFLRSKNSGKVPAWFNRLREVCFNDRIPSDFWGPFPL